MIEGLKRDWRQLRTGKPGDRFQGYQRAHAEAQHGKWTRFVSLGGGILLIAVGIVAVPAPGPGWLIIGLGAALFARESAMVARALDAIEVRLRKALAWGREVWTQSSIAIRVLIGLTGTALAAGAGVIAYNLIVAG